MPPTSAPALTLYTIAMSHYSEKIRWLLDAEKLLYREVALTPVFHIRPMLVKGLRGQTTVPLLEAGSQRIQDSTRIIEWLAKARGPLATLPAAQRAEIMAVEERFDAIGKDVARYLYYTGFAHTDEILRLWTRFATPAQARVIRLGYPLFKAVFKLKLSIHARAAQRAEQRIDEALRGLEAHLASGKRYLVGDQFSVADITAAALLAPMACPLEHKVYGEASFREHMASTNPLWQNRAGLDWVRSIYAQHRGPMWATMPLPA
jgi:glutathione S-transferase